MRRFFGKFIETDARVRSAVVEEAMRSQHRKLALEVRQRTLGLRGLTGS